ncbi:hypothetical protein ACI797_12825 [Geodermatophilus sp. SYSU D00691]
MVPLPVSGPPVLSRRTLLAGTAAGLGVLLVGCTSSDDGGTPVTPEQADELAGQVAVQEALVAAFAAASTADPALGGQVADLAAQAGEQLDRLRAAAPGAPSPASGSAGATPPSPGEARAWLRTEVSTAADSHAAACLDQHGARAALLGSVAAGLRGMGGRLA